MNFLKIFSLILCALSISCNSWAQKPEDVNGHCANKKFHKKVKNLLNFSVPTIDVDELKENLNEVYIFDAREKEEFEVSHIPNARYIGYNKFEVNNLNEIPKDAKIVVYCSIGYRSEKIGEKLQKAGFNNVSNLYGSIFEWINRGYEVEDANGQITKKVHTYNQSWSKWVEEGKATEIW